MKGALNIVKEEQADEQTPASNPRHPRRFSLVHQASCETQHKAGLKRQNTIQHRQELQEGILRGKQILKQLNDEGIELIWAAEDSLIGFSSVLTSHASLPEFIGAVVRCFQESGIDIQHMETRKPTDGKGWDLLTDCSGTKAQLVSAASSLTQQHMDLTRFALYKKDPGTEVPWFPRHIAELDKCSNCLTKYEPTTDPRHPGHGDAAYIARREFLNDQAKEYKHGDPIPYVDYSPEEHATWTAVYDKLKELHLTHACETYRRNFKKLEEQGVLSPDKIPQLKDINTFLSRKTGFILRPCSGLLSARDFLASLAFRVFQTTTYLRHSGHPHHSPEPDLIHELLGHVPMFADPQLAQLSQDIGLMSLGATDEQIEKLATVYWFIVEFGLCREGGRLKAIGAGLLSAYGELQHACSDTPDHKDFDPSVTAIQKYEDDDYQPLYFVANSIQDALIKLRQYATSMNRPFSVLFDPITRSVETVRTTSDLESPLSRFQCEFGAITSAVEKCKLDKKELH